MKRRIVAAQKTTLFSAPDVAPHQNPGKKLMNHRKSFGSKQQSLLNRYNKKQDTPSSIYEKKGKVKPSDASKPPSTMAAARSCTSLTSNKVKTKDLTRSSVFSLKNAANNKP